MPEDWIEWVGRTIADDIPLLEFLGGSGDTAVFSTAILDRQGVVKLVVMDPENAKERVATFKQAERLSHPHLLRVFRSGKCKVEEETLVYMVTEFAAENVAQVLPDRALTSEETLAMLTATLSALQYLHAQGFVHADLKPSNVMATGNQVKISVDGVHRIGEPLARTTTSPYDAPEVKAVLTPASDMWSVGVTVAKVLTQKVAESPKAAEKFEPPFRDVVMRCLTPEPERRPSVIDLYNILEGKTVAEPGQLASGSMSEQVLEEDEESKPVARSSRAKSASRSSSYKLPLLVAATVAVVIAIVVGISRHQDGPSTTMGEPPSASTSSASNGSKSGGTHSAAEAKPPAIIARVLPNVSPEAQGTITGTIRIGVKVAVDPNGNVVDSELTSLGPSRYFDNLALQAARQWKFAKSPQSSAWELQFNFTKKDTTVVPTSINR